MSLDKESTMQDYADSPQSKCVEMDRVIWISTMDLHTTEQSSMD